MTETPRYLSKLFSSIDIQAKNRMLAIYSKIKEKVALLLLAN